MTTGTQSHPDEKSELVPRPAPEISACESCPGKIVFLESGNTDGWLSSDVTVEVRR
jgi:hypothetical protein